MHEYPTIVFAALLIFGFGLFSKLSERSAVTAPMFFMAVGALFSPLGFGFFETSLTIDAAKVLAEITLILILFVDASLIRYKQLGHALVGIPSRLLGIGLPLTIVLGGLVAYLMFPGINIWLITLVALILSPTDAALGQAILKSPFVPQKLKDGLSIESGLNDGIALPPFLVCLAVLSEGVQVIDGSGHWLKFMVMQLTLGPLVGGLVGWSGGKALDWAVSKGFSEGTFQRLSAIALALMAFAFAEAVHGNGFIAAFFAGLFLGTRREEVRERIQEFGEAEGQLLSLIIFMLFGLVMLPLAVQHWTPWMLVYAVLSLTFIRMLPVLLSLIGSGLSLKDKLFIGWFGPRGIASVLYLLIAAGNLGLKGYEQALSLIILTVLLSTFSHGISSIPLAALYKKK